MNIIINYDKTDHYLKFITFTNLAIHSRFQTNVVCTREGIYGIIEFCIDVAIIAVSCAFVNIQIKIDISIKRNNQYSLFYRYLHKYPLLHVDCSLCIDGTIIVIKECCAFVNI